MDAVVIGSGQAGVPFAKALAARGKQVVLFESGAFGGSCINYGCTPSKAFLASAHSAGRARRARSLGVHAEVSVDFAAVMERAHGIVTQWSKGVEQGLIDAGVCVVREPASFSGPKTVRGGSVEEQAPLVVIDTGTSAAVPAIAGLDNTPFLTNTTFFALRALPKKLLVLGGGYIGLELGQGMQRCGSEVHIIDPAERVLEREEPDVSDVLQTSLTDDGVTLHLGAQVERVAYVAPTFTLTCADGTQLQGDALLVATGRVPNTSQLNLGASGIETDARGFVKIDEHFNTTCAGVYAVGDVAAGEPQFTHVSWEDYRRLLSILDGKPRTRDDRVLAYAVFTEPQLGRVGLTLHAARAKGYAARAVTYPASSIARGVEWNELRGFYRLVIDETSEKLLGATLVGYEAGEIVHAILAHIQNGATWHTLDESVHIHPTFSEALPTTARLFQ